MSYHHISDVADACRLAINLHETEMNAKDAIIELLESRIEELEARIDQLEQS